MLAFAVVVVVAAAAGVAAVVVEELFLCAVKPNAMAVQHRPDQT
jgi:hypothetical protein